MDKPWAISGVDLYLDLSGSRVRAGLETALREAVQAGRLAPGTRLPSTRALAADLGIARNTIAEAYSQLTAEGWLTEAAWPGRPGAGLTLSRCGQGKGREPGHATCPRSVSPSTSAARSTESAMAS
jgi:GntR family transcriptional regulator/MocR family aminotransferase